MPKEIICTPEAPQSPMYSQAVKADNTVYVAGTTGVDVTTGIPRRREHVHSGQ
jgi:2-iminobutanoate/2-iminopropanoate deaminase